MAFIVALDGPAGSGKGTVTKLLAKKMGLTNIDTGAMYRCITLEMINKNVKIDELDKITELLKNIDIKLDDTNERQLVFLNGEDVSDKIREKQVNELVSPVSTIAIVREKMTELQRKMGKNEDIIMEGRDIGTTVFPNADVKIYLDASVEERAKRRLKQNEEKGIKMSYEEVVENIKFRDKTDSTREVAPLKKAEDAIVIDSSNMSINQVVSEIEKIIKKKIKAISAEKKAFVQRKDSKLKFVERQFLLKTVHILYRIFFRIECVGEKIIPEDDNSYIVCANHLNYFDAIAVITSSNRFVRFMCKSSMFKVGLFSHVLKIGDAIPVNREKQDIETMKRALKALKNKEILRYFSRRNKKRNGEEFRC